MHLPPAGDLRHAFEQQGFVLVRRFLDEDATARLAGLAADLLRRRGVRIVRRSGDEMLDYHVVTGDTIQTEAAAIHALYVSPDLLTWVRKVTAVPDVTRSSHLRSAVNINGLDTRGQRYPWHNDAVPFTILLFLSSVPETAGGEFLIRTSSDEVAMIRPESGALVLMDGHRCAHAVAPLRQDVRRLSVPMVFPAVGGERPGGLDDFLYSSER